MINKKIKYSIKSFRLKQKSLSQQQGAALIIALFITALVATASIAMMTRLQIDTRRTELILNATQAYFYANGSLLWAKEQLKNNWLQKQKNQLIDRTPIHSEENNVEQFIISSVIYDATGYFNINNLTNPAYQESFERLVHIVSPKLDTQTVHDIVLAIIDWISPTHHLINLEDYYAKQNPPYRAPQKPMASISELRLIKGVTSDLYAALAPHLTALPELTPININNASVPVLMCLSPTLTTASAHAIIMHRKQQPFKNIEEFMQWDVVKNNPFAQENISVQGSYFLVKTQVKIKDQNVIIYTLLNRLIKNNIPTLEIIWQSKGTL